MYTNMTTNNRCYSLRTTYLTSEPNYHQITVYRTCSKNGPYLPSEMRLPRTKQGPSARIDGFCRRHFEMPPRKDFRSDRAFKVVSFKAGKAVKKQKINIRGRLTVHKTETSSFAESTAPVSQSSWARISFRPEFFQALILQLLKLCIFLR